MMFDPDLFWQFAETLLRDSNADECKCRTAAGRAYYAFFLMVRNRLDIDHGIKFAHDATDHSYEIRLLKNRDRDAIAQALAQLLRLREDAGYEMGVAVNIARVSLAIDKARIQYSNARVL